MEKITNYAKKRNVFYVILACIIFILPFIRINANHFFLLSFDKKLLNLFFISFNTNELYLMPFLLIMMFVFIFFITNLLGRVWCAWGCPQTMLRIVYRDILQTKIFKIYNTRKNKQVKPKDKLFSKALSVLIFYFISLVVASNFLWYFIPPEDFFEYIKDPKEHMLLIGIIFCLSAFITFDITFIKENFCAYICPYARIQSVMFDNDTKTVIYDESRGGIIYKNGDKISKKPVGAECIGCEACVKVCPTHIDIRKGMQLDCINCLECADACSSVQARFNRPSLISWSSTKEIKTKEKYKFFRFRTIVYLLVLSVLFVGLVYKASNKEKVLVNINRTSELFSLKDNGKIVENAYVILLHNTDSKAHKFIIESMDKNIKVHSPKRDIKLNAGQKHKKILILQSLNNAKNIENSKINLKIYAKDNNKISAIKETVFIYPKENKWKEKKE